LAAELSKNTTVDDLTRGIINYKYLGLDFEKAENQKLRYVKYFDALPVARGASSLVSFCGFGSLSFSQIDPENPSRKFSFVLGANEYDVYNIEECSPAIEQALLQALLDNLNANDDLGQFVMKMRLAFAETL
jgi:hypothetical protein